MKLFALAILLGLGLQTATAVAHPVHTPPMTTQPIFPHPFGGR